MEGGSARKKEPVFLHDDLFSVLSSPGLLDFTQGRNEGSAFAVIVTLAAVHYRVGTHPDPLLQLLNPLVASGIIEDDALLPLLEAVEEHYDILAGGLQALPYRDMFPRSVKKDYNHPGRTVYRLLLRQSGSAVPVRKTGDGITVAYG